MKEHIQKTEQEFCNYYASFDPYTEPLLTKLDEMVKEHEGESSYLLKTRMYEILCEECPVHLFEESDFFFEMSSGRGRYTWGGLQSPVGSYFREKAAPVWIAPYLEELKEDMQEGYMWAYSPISVDHHCPGYYKLLNLGLIGIISQAKEQLLDCTDERKREFYECVIRANQALIHLASRFEAEARRLAALDGGRSEHYLKIAEAAKSIQSGAPKTFYEALCLIVFYRECASSIEGIGISIFGLLDQMLYPYYQADLQAGRITREEALRLLCDLLTYTDARFNVHEVFRETSTTIEIGGCDREGNIVYNEVTRLILEAVVNVRVVNTKVNCRISQNHPEEFLKQIAAVQLENLPMIMMHNDDVLIQSRVRYGQEIEDARLYAGGGCHEIVLQETEVCTRAETWLNLPRLLVRTMERGGKFHTYEDFFEAYVQDVREYHEKITALKNKREQYWCQYDPLVLYSSSIEGCLEKGLDVTEGGAKYNTVTLSMLGTATLIDSLYAIKKLIYDEKRLTFEEYCDILSKNFEGQEALRQSIIRKLPKHGTNDAELNPFAAEVLHRLSEVSGQKNARGGDYMPAFYPHDIFRSIGHVTCATPDGRLAGTPLSRGVSPSEFVATDSPLDVIQSLGTIDFTEYADSFITEVTLPALNDKEQGEKILLSLIRGFLEKKGSSLQFNLLDCEALKDAQKNPEQYPNLCVRVCGYSAKFTTLAKEIQDEVIERAVR